MPIKAKKPCNEPGCPKLTNTKYCEYHARQHIQDWDNSAHREYDSKWRKASKRFLKEHPLCINCSKGNVNFLWRNNRKLWSVTLFSGVCKVNAAIATQILIDTYGCNLIINACTAGGDEINLRFQPLSMDMETASIAHVCYVNKIPYIAICTITDTVVHSGVETF